MGTWTKRFFDVRLGKKRKVVRVHVACPKEALEVRWVYVPPGILLPVEAVNVDEGCWLRMKLDRDPESDPALDVFFIEATYYEQLKTEEPSSPKVDKPCPKGQYTCPEDGLGGFRGTSTHGLTTTRKSYSNGPRQGHRRSLGGGSVVSTRNHRAG